jgi:6-pyruvoyl-tetrahydropterin synthase
MQALFVDNLTVIDFAYFDPKRGIVGESLILDVELFGELNDEGMLFDFSYVKKRIKSCVDSLIDHKFLIAMNHESTRVEDSPQQLKLQLRTDNGEMVTHLSPHEAVYLLDSESVTPESIAIVLRSEIKNILPDNVADLTLQLRPEVIDGPYYHYSHGLKKHFGDCQRIAHGHRSRIQVWENGIFSNSLSSKIATIWQDIYLATEDDIKETVSIDNLDYYVFEYHANQGLFQLTLPKNRCYLMDSDTTVELIASHLAELLKQENPNSKIKIKAFEGVDKGAAITLN